MPAILLRSVPTANASPQGLLMALRGYGILIVVIALSAANASTSWRSTLWPSVRTQPILLTASWDGTVRLWDTETGGLIRVCQVEGNRIYHGNISPRGDRVATVCWLGGNGAHLGSP